MASRTRSRRQAEIELETDATIELQNDAPSDYESEPGYDRRTSEPPYQTDSSLTPVPETDLDEMEPRARTPQATAIQQAPGLPVLPAAGASQDQLLTFMQGVMNTMTESLRASQAANNSLLTSTLNLSNQNAGTANVAAPTRTVLYKMQDPPRYNGGHKELKRFLQALRANFASHSHLFPKGGPDHVQYAVTRLGTWKAHSNPTQRNLGIIDPLEWAEDLLSTNPECGEDFKLFAEELTNFFGDPDAARKAELQLLEARQRQGEPIRRYGQRLEAIFKETRLGSQKSPITSEDVYHLLLRNSMDQSLLWRTRATSNTKDGSFLSSKQLIERATMIETPNIEAANLKKGNFNTTTNTAPAEGGQVKTSGSGNPAGNCDKRQGNRKRKDKDEPVVASSTALVLHRNSKRGVSAPSSLPVAPWVSVEVLKARKVAKQCFRYGDPDHHSPQCDRYAAYNRPPDETLAEASTSTSPNQISSGPPNKRPRKAGSSGASNQVKN